PFGGDLLVVALLVRIDMLVHERQQLGLHLLDAWRILEIHVGLPGWWSSVLRIQPFCIRSTIRQPDSASPRARRPDSNALSLDAVPSTARFMMPCRMPASRNML